MENQYDTKKVHEALSKLHDADYEKLQQLMKEKNVIPHEGLLEEVKRQYKQNKEKRPYDTAYQIASVMAEFVPLESKNLDDVMNTIVEASETKIDKDTIEKAKEVIRHSYRNSLINNVGIIDTPERVK